MKVRYDNGHKGRVYSGEPGEIVRKIFEDEGRWLGVKSKNQFMSGIIGRINLMYKKEIVLIGHTDEERCRLFLLLLAKWWGARILEN